ncbi:MAG TPA: aminotransferase class I/II-fold pyridoxal phosphate-dependent enzyme [Pyrinomonadaceae bacterium]|nr:aminotransferase class I/II-fold pyridoxal phosphate-dependent enzyme [Pyrinomonadaceae bacterium]
MKTKSRPDIRALTRLVPRTGNLVQGQSELAIDPALAEAASRIIASSQNHYSPAEGLLELRRAVAEKIATFNGIIVDPEAVPLQLLITPGATGSLIAIAQTYLTNASALVLEPYYPYHRHILNELGGRTEMLDLHGQKLELDVDELRARCRELKNRTEFPLRAIILCTPVNPTGKVFNRSELEVIAATCQEFDLLCIADEVYEHYVVGAQPHISIATLPGMWERTITVNSFSKSWNISGWRLGYVYGDARLVAPLNKANNVFYVCSPTPLQRALSEVLMTDPQYYSDLKKRFSEKRKFAIQSLEETGFEVYDSGSAFYVWAHIPPGFDDAMQLNQMLIERAGVAGVPGSAFADGDQWDNYMRLCIAREDEVLQGALGKLQSALMSFS